MLTMPSSSGILLRNSVDDYMIDDDSFVGIDEPEIKRNEKMILKLLLSLPLVFVMFLLVKPTLIDFLLLIPALVVMELFIVFGVGSIEE